MTKFSTDKGYGFSLSKIFPEEDQDSFYEGPLYIYPEEQDAEKICKTLRMMANFIERYPEGHFEFNFDE